MGHFNKNSAKLRYSVITAILMGMPFLGACSHNKVKDDSTIAGDTQLNAAINDSTSSDLGNAYGLKTVHFGFDSSLLGKEAKLTLNDNADILKKNPILHVQIEGHCDRMGGIQYNLALGQRRADGVKHYLVDRGVRESQLSTISYGKEKPLDTAQTEEADAKNRRANLVVTKGMI